MGQYTQNNKKLTRKLNPKKRLGKKEKKKSTDDDHQFCINWERSLRRKEISFCENSGLVMAPSSSLEGDDNGGDDDGGGLIIMSVVDSIISSTKSTITPSIPITYCMYTASPTLLQHNIWNKINTNQWSDPTAISKQT